LIFLGGAGVLALIGIALLLFSEIARWIGLVTKYLRRNGK
jgi:hypothetical protein